jgi:hypothetical protein
MDLKLDHLFVCTELGAPEAGELIKFGLREGEPNTHPDQGSACRRFPFANAMIELFWISNPAEAKSPLTQPTLLWERWSGRHLGASPFGVCLRPAGNFRTGADPSPGSRQGSDPFPGWTYKPSYLPEPLAFHIGHAGIDEPMWVYLGFMRRNHREAHFIEHPARLREITGLTLHTPTPLKSEVSRAIVESGILCTRPAGEPLLDIEFDHLRQRRSHDLRPSLPLVFHF